MVIFPKNVVSALIVRFFQRKVRKSRTWGKFKKIDEHGMFFREKKHYLFFRSILYKNRKAQSRWQPAILFWNTFENTFCHEMILSVAKWNRDMHWSDEIPKTLILALIQSPENSATSLPRLILSKVLGSEVTLAESWRKKCIEPHSFSSRLCNIYFIVLWYVGTLRMVHPRRQMDVATYLRCL